MTTIHLVRHASTDSVDSWIAGWLEGVMLNEVGRAQARRLAARLADVPVRAVYASPLERTRETARAIAEPHGLDVSIDDDFGELRFGLWTGRTLDELREDPAWHDYQRCRGMRRPPGGESIAEAQARMARGLERVCAAHPGEHVVVVSHGDPIRSLLAHVVGSPIDLLDRFDVLPASLQVIDVRWGVPVLCAVNDLAHLAREPETSPGGPGR